MLKLRNPLILLVLAVASFLFFNACESKKGSLNPNLPPVISITDYFGVDEISELGDAHIFRQTIRWSSYDPDGVVTGFSFKVLDADGVAIPTPGFEVLGEEGWVKHYLPGADTSIPLDESEETTIWLTKQGLQSQSNELYTTQITINFPAANENGDSVNVISEFQVRGIDNNGGISNIASKYFNAYSDIPRATVSSSKGAIDGKTIGRGVVFEFSIIDDLDINSASTEAYYYKYKFEKRDLDGNVVPESEGGYPDYPDNGWPDTYGQTPNNEITISNETPFTLSTNFDDEGNIVDSTFLYVKGVNLAGIVTSTSVTSFLVSDKFTPGTIIYFGRNAGQKNDIYALGTYHFATYLDESMSTTVPAIETSSGLRNATAMWVNAEGQYQLIGSQDIKVYMHWGWNGEYEENNPFKKLADKTLDEATNQSYFAEIVAFDLRLNGQPLYYPPLPAVGENLIVDEDGTEWLRVPISHPISQRVTLNSTNLSLLNGSLYGEHVFEARAVDLQGVSDPTPDVFTFHIYEPVVNNEKQGILIIDEEVDNSAFSPGPYIDDFYNSIISDFDSDPGYIDLIELKTIVSTQLNLFDLHYKKSVISPAEIQSYKTIIFHSDNPVNETSFWKEYESFKIYLTQGGNIILSGGSNLSTLQNKLRANGFPLLEEYFGIPLLEENVIIKASENWPNNPFFINAVSTTDQSLDIALQIPGFNNLLNIYGGLGPVSYFQENIISSEIIYRYGCKSVDSDTFPPTQEQFDQFNNLPVGLKYSSHNNTNNCAIFSFPLSYMNIEDATDMMNYILQDFGH